MEYVLIVALLLFASAGAIKTLERNADSYYDNTSADIGDLPGTGVVAPTGTSIPGGSSTTTTAAPTTTAPTTTTTAAPTTTTTAAPTTTTSTSTTTTTVAQRSRVSGTAANSGTGGSTTWDPGLRVTVTNSVTGAVITGAAVTVVFKTTGGSTLGTASCTTTSTAGRCTASITGVSNNYSSVVATVTAMSASPAWDGVTASLSLPQV